MAVCTTLECSICLRQFEKPKIISCHHTFCTECLVNHVKSTFCNDSFQCPICRKEIPIPDGGAIMFPNNFYIEELKAVKKLYKRKEREFHKRDWINFTIVICLFCIVFCLVNLFLGRSPNTRAPIGSSINTESDLDSRIDYNEKLLKNTQQCSFRSYGVGNQTVDHHYCHKHKTKELKFFCRDCNIPVCGDCILVKHRTHTVVDIEDVASEVFEELTNIKVEFEEKINDHKSVIESLNQKSSEIIKVADEAMGEIDFRVNRIHHDIRVKGEALKSEIQKLKKQENEKLSEVRDEANRLIKKLQIGADVSKELIERQSIIPVIDMLPNARKNKGELLNINLNIPSVRFPNITMTDVNVDILSKQIGQLEIQEESTFTVFININQIPTEKYYCTPEYHRINNISWNHQIRHNVDKSSFGIYLTRHILSGDHLKRVSVNFTVKLVNHKDVRKSIIEQAYSIFTNSNKANWGWSDFGDWNTITDTKNGYLDTKNNFKIRTTVNIINVEGEF